MDASSKGFGQWLERRFPWTGLVAVLDDPGTTRPLVSAAFAGSAANVSFLAALFWAFGRPGMAALQVAFIAIYLGGMWMTLAAPRSNLAPLVAVWASLVGQVVGHVIMGGYFYSGGYALFGMAVVVLACLLLSRAQVLAMWATYACVAVALGFAEGRLQDSRQAPDLALPTIVVVDVFLVTMAVIVPLFLGLVALIRSEKARSTALLLNILPARIADRLKAGPGMIADRHEACSIVFADLVGFTEHSKGKDPAQIVGELNTIFTRFDALAAEHGAEKIKTIGDGYLAATGLPDPHPAHVERACGLALAMLDAMPALNRALGTDYQLRVGVHTGTAVAGVVGTSKFSYDVWGDTVNLAARLESNGVPGRAVASAAVAAALEGRYALEPLGARDLKGQGPTQMYRLIGPAATGR